MAVNQVLHVTDNEGYTFDLTLSGEVAAESDPTNAPPGQTNLKYNMNVDVSFESTSGDHAIPYNPAITVSAFFDKSSQICQTVKSTDDYFLADLKRYCIRSAGYYFFNSGGDGEPAYTNKYAGVKRESDYDANDDIAFYSSQQPTITVSISAGNRGFNIADDVLDINCPERPGIFWATQNPFDCDY